MLGQVADPGERGLVADWLAEERSAGPSGPHHRHHDLDQRGLAGAVGAEQSEDLAAVHLHLDIPQRVDAAGIDLLDAVQVDRVLDFGGTHENEKDTVKMADEVIGPRPGPSAYRGDHVPYAHGFPAGARVAGRALPDYGAGLAAPGDRGDRRSACQIARSHRERSGQDVRSAPRRPAVAKALSVRPGRPAVTFRS